MMTPSAMRMDPGQLLALHALLEEASVTSAARRMGITQSSMSHRLAQLRQALGDPLFVRVGAKLAPTPRARAMARPLADALRALEAAVAPPEVFDPKTTRGVLSLAIPDLLTPLVQRLVVTLAEQAPGLELRVRPIVPELSMALAEEVPSVALTPRRFVEGDVHTRALGELRFGVVGRRRHPALQRRLTTDRWLSQPHVVVRIGNEPVNVVDEELKKRGLERRIGLEVPSFLAGLLVVAGSDLLMNAPLPLAEEAAAALRLKVCDAPVALPRIPFVMAWHARFHQDPAHRWAREQVFGVAQRGFNR